MTDKYAALLQIIYDIEYSVPIKKDKIESIFDGKMILQSSGNKYYTFWSMRPERAVKGITFEEISISVKNHDDFDPGAITLKILKPCFSLPELKTYFKNLQWVGTPRGHSLDEEVTFTQELQWAQMVIGFAERNPDCLSSIGFAPHKLVERRP